MRLKTKRWTENRGERKFGMVLRRFEDYVHRHQRRKLHLGLALVLSIAIVSLYASPQEAQPAFEVASIERDVGGQPGMADVHPCTEANIGMCRVFPDFHLERATLKDLVTMAYQVHDFQVTGGPGWINSDRYTIDAKAVEPPTTAFSKELQTLQYRRLQTRSVTGST